jgi:hypothetical protein
MENAGTTLGKYPGPIKDAKTSITGIAQDITKDVGHFPLEWRPADKGGPIDYTGPSTKSKVRVFYEHNKGDAEARFLGVWTHDGMPAGKFAKGRAASDTAGDGAGDGAGE